jgi:hypothetical protein
MYNTFLVNFSNFISKMMMHKRGISIRLRCNFMDWIILIVALISVFTILTIIFHWTIINYNPIHLTQTAIDQFNSLIKDISIGILVSCIFYGLNVIFNEWKKERLAQQAMSEKLKDLLIELFYLFNYLSFRSATKYTDIAKEGIDFTPLKDTVDYPEKTFLNYNTLLDNKDFQTNDIEYVTLRINKIYDYTDFLLQLPFLTSISDYKIIELISAIRGSEYLITLKMKILNIDTGQDQLINCAVNDVPESIKLFNIFEELSWYNPQWLQWFKKYGSSQ